MRDPASNTREEDTQPRPLTPHAAHTMNPVLPSVLLEWPCGLHSDALSPAHSRNRLPGLHTEEALAGMAESIILSPKPETHVVIGGSLFSPRWL